MIDLRSDTVTQPSAAMREVMHSADLGDDVYGEDPTVNELEELAATILGKEAGLFAPSGTQSNLLALLTHCGRGDEYIVGNNAHTYRYEGGGAAVLGGIQPQPVNMPISGELELDELRAVIKPDDFHFARSALICLENTHGGRPLGSGYCDQVRTLCDEHGLALHLDGARLFNAAVANGESAKTIAEPFDTVSICLSKGLGAPIGSVLVGPEHLISEARRWRKVLGGGMRQVGLLGAAGIFALQNNVDRLALDHAHADQVGKAISSKFGPEMVAWATNMLHLHLPTEVYSTLAEHLLQNGIKVGRPRWVFHLDVSDRDIEIICDAIAKA